MNEWDTEPDKLEWEHAGFKCLILRTSEMKHLCGYVGLPKWHPYYGKEYGQCLLGCEGNVPDFHPPNERDAYWYNCTFEENHPSLEKIIRVHGGLTFSQEGDGKSWDKDLWWLGFDCAHAGDLVPGIRTLLDKEGHYMRGRIGITEVYRSISYVVKETEHLAEQLTITEIAKRGFRNESHS